jgi:hypothetical protein
MCTFDLVRLTLTGCVEQALPEQASGLDGVAEQGRGLDGATVAAGGHHVGVDVVGALVKNLAADASPGELQRETRTDRVIRNLENCKRSIKGNT